MNSSPHRLVVVTIALTYVFVGCAVLLPYSNVRGFTHPFLMLASTGFMVVAFLACAWRHAYGRWMLGGLSLCWMGDLLGPSNFALGAGMFLLAHVLFVIAFAVSSLNRSNVMKSLVLLVPSGAILAWLLPQVESPMRALVVAYTLVITVMLIVAGGTRRLVFIGALVFYVSDVFVARWRFVDHDSINALICYPLYYTACLILAYSLFGGTGQTVDEHSEENPQLA